MSHPTWGAWIETKSPFFFVHGLPSRTPRGVRGLKPRCRLARQLENCRTPRGVRGLKHRCGIRYPMPIRRTPRGVRGLKRAAVVVSGCVNPSHPTWGAWIETRSVRSCRRTHQSHPTWGAWIETPVSWRCRTGKGVAPHVGCVD